MKKSVFVIGLLIGIFLVGVVSAGTNVALISNNATSIATGNINLGISNDTHDGSMDNYVAGNPHNPLNDYFNGIQFTAWNGFTGTVEITLNQSYDLSNINYDMVYYWTPAGVDEISIYSGGSWTTISCVVISNQKYISTNDYVWLTSLNCSGSFMNVEKIKYYINRPSANPGGSHSPDLYERVTLRELRAIGTGSCNPNCSSGRVCGGDGCGGSCGTCTEPETSCNPSRMCEYFGPCDSPDDIILRLYQDENSHAATYDGSTDYGIGICYSDFYDTGPLTTPHSCSSDYFLWLNDTYNSHVSATSGSGYDTGICYGDLDCSVIDGASETCTGTIIAKLNDTSNSHIANNNSVLYSHELCCGGSVIIPPSGSGFFWTDTMGNTIIDGDPGDTFLMKYVGATAADNYTVKEEDFGFDNTIKEDIISNLIAGTSIAIWESNITNILNEAGSYERFFFLVPDKFSDVGRPPYLNLSDADGLRHDVNDPTTAKILHPPMSHKALVGSVIHFNQSTEDEDDLLKLTWDFNLFDSASVNTFFNNVFESNEGNTTHAYTSAGSKIVRLNADPMRPERGDGDFDTTEVLVYDPNGPLGPGNGALSVFARLTNPDPLITTIIDTPVITVNANSSYVAECFGNSDQANCISAEETYGYNIGSCYPVETLWCYDLDKGQIKGDNPTGFWDFYFRWEFDDGQIKQGKWTSVDAEPVEWIKVFNTDGEHTFDLDVGYVKL
jgi:hypothetical protein